MKNKTGFKRFVDILADILLIMLVLIITDLITRNVFHTDKLIFELLVYVLVYCVFAAIRWLVKYIWRRFVKGKSDDAQ